MATRRWISTGSTDFATAANWSGTTVPISGDTVVIERNSVDIAASNQSAIALAALYIRNDYTGKIGDVDNYFQIGTSILEIGRDDAAIKSPGSPRLNLDLGSATACAVSIINTCTIAADYGLLPVRLKAANASTSIKMRSGKVDLASYTSETSTLAAIEVGHLGGSPGDTLLVLGESVTNTTVRVMSGKVVTRSGITTATVCAGGVLQIDGAGAVSVALLVCGGRAIVNTTGTIAACTVSDNGWLDCLSAVNARTFTALTLTIPYTLTMHPSATLSAVTLTNSLPFRLVGAYA